MKSPRLTPRWAGRRSEGEGLEAGLHVELKEGLLRALKALWFRDPDRLVASHSAPP